jgi:uncharacterized protein YqgQ
MNTTVKYDIEVIKEEVLDLVSKGLVNRQDPIFTICRHVPKREWIYFEQELDKNEFLLRDRIIDLLSSEQWSED